MDSRRDSSAVILLPITPRSNMSPRWGFKTFGYPVVYKHAAPLGLNTAASPSPFLTLSPSHFLSPRFPVLSGHWVLSQPSPMMGIVAAP